jgi:Zn-finger nucleic acid-binding protein
MLQARGRMGGGGAVLVCDRCGIELRPPGRSELLIDDAKAYGWTRRRRYQATRDYCPQCSASIERFAEGRRERDA